MTEVLFYHLERARLEDVLPGLLEKTLARGWRALVRAGSRARVEALDEYLWTYRDDAFLPHGAGLDGDAARQPVWLTDGDDRLNDAEVLFIVDGARRPADALEPFARCVTIFDGGDETALGEARAFWKAVKAAGHEATYWRQTSAGRWEKQA